MYKKDWHVTTKTLMGIYGLDFGGAHCKNRNDGYISTMFFPECVAKVPAGWSLSLHIHASLSVLESSNHISSLAASSTFSPVPMPSTLYFSNSKNTFSWAVNAFIVGTRGFAQWAAKRSAIAGGTPLAGWAKGNVYMAREEASIGGAIPTGKLNTLIRTSSATSHDRILLTKP